MPAWSPRRSSSTAQASGWTNCTTLDTDGQPVLDEPLEDRTCVARLDHDAVAELLPVFVRDVRVDAIARSLGERVRRTTLR